jgi:hypothetical protein
VKFHAAPVGDTGTCRARPPAALLLGHVKAKVALGPPQPVIQGVFPIISKDEWCFEHQEDPNFVANVAPSILLPASGGLIRGREDDKVA